MSFDNTHYPNRKDRRKQYIRRGAASRSCRPHGGCPYCFNSRMHKNRKRITIAKEKIKENLKCM